MLLWLIRQLDRGSSLAQRQGMGGQRANGGVRSALGFSLVDMLATIAVIGTVAAIAVPAVTKSFENQRLGIETRNVERELQTARLQAVSSNTPIRVRFNCPATGQYRRVELIGTVNNPAADDSDSAGATRCSTTNYPYPAPDRDPLTRPNHDGPLLALNPAVTFQTAQTIEFWPNGTVHIFSTTNPWPMVGTTPVSIILNKNSMTKTITVNSLGKIQIQ